MARSRAPKPLPKPSDRKPEPRFKKEKTLQEALFLIDAARLDDLTRQDISDADLASHSAARAAMSDRVRRLRFSGQSDKLRADRSKEA